MHSAQSLYETHGIKPADRPRRRRRGFWAGLRRFAVLMLLDWSASDRSRDDV